MIVMDTHRNGIGYDTDQKTFDRTVKALERLMYAKRAPITVRIQARQLHDAALYTGRVGNTGPWVRDMLAQYVVIGNIPLALILSIVPLIVVDQPFLAVAGFIGVVWGVYEGTRILRARRVRKSGRIPKV